jgi:hypothetical protein
MILNPFSRHYHEMVEEYLSVLRPFFSKEVAAHQMAAGGLPEFMMEPTLEAVEQASEKLAGIGITPNALFPLGHDTDDGNLAWVVHSNPDCWRVLICYTRRGDNLFEVLDCGLCTFLVDYFSSRLKVQGWAHRLVAGRAQRYWFEPAGL